MTRMLAAYGLSSTLYNFFLMIQRIKQDIDGCIGKMGSITNSFYREINDALASRDWRGVERASKRFTAPTWKKVKVLLVGTVLVRGRRMVVAALRQKGHGADEQYSQYHQVLNRAK